MTAVFPKPLLSGLEKRRRAPSLPRTPRDPSPRATAKRSGPRYSTWEMPAPGGAGMATAAPPARDTLRGWAPAMKAIHSPSGEKLIVKAPSEPSTFLAASSSSRRVKMPSRSPPPAAT
jgi:hypothetical protein